MNKFKQEMNFEITDIVFSLVMLVCGFLYWNLINAMFMGIGVTIFAIVLFTVTYVYLLQSNHKQNFPSLLCLLVALVSALQFTIFDDTIITQLNFIFISATYIYWVCLSTNRRIDKELSAYIIGDAYNQVLKIPFLNFDCLPFSFKKISKYKNMNGLMAALIGILVCMPLMGIIISLLMSADIAFENFINDVIKIFEMDKVMEYFIQFIFGIPVALYLYGLVYGNNKNRYTDTITVETVDKTADVIKKAPKITIYTVLTMFNVIYLVFFAVQAVYLFSAFGGVLPSTFTYAEYARRGFFELCNVAGINLGILAVTHLVMKRAQKEEPKLLRIHTILTSSFTILLIITALSKMVMYINAYGLTQLRIYTSWFMILLLFVFVTICVRQIKKFNASKTIVLGSVVLFLMLSYANIDGMIAKYNVSMYLNGKIDSLDIDMLSQLSDATIMPIYEAYANTPWERADIKTELMHAMTQNINYAPSDFRAFNFQTHSANKIRTKLYLPQNR